MPNTTGYNFGDVVLVPFPFTDQTASKKRPAVVVSADAYHQRRLDVILMAVTSQILRPAGALGEVLISDWQGAGLPKASLIKPVLATIEQRSDGAGVTAQPRPAATPGQPASARHDRRRARDRRRGARSSSRYFPGALCLLSQS